MHSSRMRTGRSLTVCCSLLPVGGGGLLLGGLLPGGSALGGVSAPKGCLLTGGVCSQGGLLLGGICSQGGGGVCSQGGGGVCSQGVSAPGGGRCIPACTEADTLPPPPWTEFLTHACENITLAQLHCGRVTIGITRINRINRRGS